MENKETKEAIPAALNDGILESVTGGTVPTLHPDVLYAKFSDSEASTPAPTRDENGNLIYIIPTTTE